jgi:hypothetical protein
LPSGPVPSIDQFSTIWAISSATNTWRLGLQRQAELDIALELGSDLGVISDGCPVLREDTAYGAYKLIIALTLPELSRTAVGRVYET